MNGKRPYTTTIQELEKRVTILEQKIFQLTKNPNKHDCKENYIKIAENCYKCTVCGKLEFE